MGYKVEWEVQPWDAIQKLLYEDGARSLIAKMLHGDLQDCAARFGDKGRFYGPVGSCSIQLLTQGGETLAVLIAPERGAVVVLELFSDEMVGDHALHQKLVQLGSTKCGGS